MGAIARTATNIRNGGTSPLAGITHAATLVAVLLVLAALASSIPRASRAAILFVVAWNMAEAKRFTAVMRTAPVTDRVILLIHVCARAITKLRQAETDAPDKPFVPVSSDEIGSAGSPVRRVSRSCPGQASRGSGSV